jgi:hypothetical protein
MAKRKYLTNQQIFNKVAKHLLEQNEKSYNGLDCVYRSPDGLMCAAGCLIPPHVLVPEGQAFSDLATAIHEESRIAHTSLALVQTLQGVHDGCNPERWPSRLREVADDFGLKCNF